MTLYNEYHGSWVESGLENVQYEDLLKDCFPFFKEQFKLGEYKVNIPPTKNISTSKFYIEDETRQEYLSTPRSNDPLIVEINRYVDHGLMEILNYRVV